VARIRSVEIKHFRGIKELVWFPSEGINCLIGPGDSGKTSILDAIDLCLGARRNIQLTDDDFYRLDVEMPISISVTLGELDDSLKSLDAYGLYVRGFDAQSETIEDEPKKDSETVLTVKLAVTSDLEPSWSLASERAEGQGQDRDLNWGDRARLAPARLGMTADYHLGWRRGSVLNRLSEQRAEISAALAKAARDAREAFGDEAQEQLGETLGIVAETAKKLGISIGENIKAELDAHSVSFSGGTISLHDEDGIPLRGLGTGSARLLIAGLQRKAAERSTIFLIDELEHGLEPHRIIRLLGSLGAKETDPPIQVFMTTHSPVALRELSASQLFVVRSVADKHEVLSVSNADYIQSTIRLYPDAFFASSIIVCEGASEVGLVRGLDQHRIANGFEAITAQGTALVDCGGGDADRLIKRAAGFRDLGYRVAVVRDDDKQPSASVEAAFIVNGGKLIAWRKRRALEDELFVSLTNEAVRKLLGRAVELHGKELVDDHIKSASENAKELIDIEYELLIDGISPESRIILGKAARAKKAGWFKSITWMEEVARDIVGPDLATADPGFRALIEEMFGWAGDAGK
jgi:hypothetical protein